MSFYALIALINAITSLVLGVFVYSHDRRSGVNRYFGLFALSVAFWSIGYFFWQVAREHESALFWVRTLMAGAILIPVFYFHFIAAFVNAVQKVKSALVFGYGLALTFVLFDLFTPYFVQDVSQKLSFQFWPNPGIAFHPFLLMFFGYVCYAWYLLILTARNSQDHKKTQIHYVFWGTFIGFLGGSTNYLLWYDIPIPPVGNLAVSVYVGMIAYAIIRKQLFDIRIILTQLLVGVIAVLLLVNVFTSQSSFEYLWKGVLLIAFLGAGYLLIRSVIDEIKYREQLQKAYAALKELDTAKSEFISIASHQLRTPLTAIKGYISLALEGTYGKLDGKMRRSMNNVYASNERLIRLVNDLLSISRIESGKMKLELERTDIQDTIQSVMEELKIKAQEKHLKLIFEEPQHVLPKIFLDQAKIRNVISNIIDNAIRYTDKGDITVRIYQQSEPQTLLIEISDTGAGMTREEIGKLFESFSRGTTGTMRWTEGAGLGLYIAKQFVQMHKGKIWAESEGKGRGSTFFIELPVQKQLTKQTKH